MKLADKIIFFVAVMIILAVVTMGAVLTQRRIDEAQKLCHPLRVKHSYTDDETSKTRAVCATSDGKDEVR